MLLSKVRFYLVLLLGNILSTIGQGQADVTTWTAVAVNIPVSDKVSFVVKPIMRHNSNLGAYSDTSLDLIVKYKLSPKWSASLLERHFFMPDQGDRQFLFFDLVHASWSQGLWKFKQGLRYHLALDHNREDPEFIRYRPNLSYRISDKLSSFAELDAFVRQSPFKLSGARYTGGLSYKLSSATSLTFVYWRQDGYPDLPIGETHNLFTTLAFKL